MAATYILRKHLRSQELANQPEANAERKARIEACARARNDRKTKFPLITPDNFEAANAYQNERFKHWSRDLSK